MKTSDRRLRSAVGRALAIALLAAVALSCRSAADASGDKVFSRVEAQLMSVKNIDVSFDAAATGPIEAKAAGDLRITGSDVAIDGRGAMKGVDTAVRFSTNDQNRPADIRHAVVIGWMRLGLMHNLVRILGDQDIEHDSGGIEEWVKVSDVRYEAAERKLIFDIDAGGEQIAVAHVWLGKDGLPQRRLETVHFPGGEMIVEEHYRWH